MQFTKLASLLSLLSYTTGAVLDVEDVVGKNIVEKRGSVGGIKICTDINWKGQCGYKVQPLSTCIKLQAPWLYTISSFGPDSGTWVTFYQDNNCEAMIGNQLTYPGSGDLRNQNLNDRIGSFMARSTPPSGHPDTPNSGPGSPFDPYKQITCSHGYPLKRDVKCNTNAYCTYTERNHFCQYKGGDKGVPSFQECAADTNCLGKNIKCVHGLCCNLNNVVRAECPSVSQLDACCFKRTSETGTVGGQQWYHEMQDTIPQELKCGC